uniref:Shroom family member 2 n=3 Tax=Iconisemion striatum TaxID=60296 RepID=A0A1A7X1E3_9TELE
MERLERPYQPGPLSPPKYISGSDPLCVSGGKRDAGFSCISGSSSPPVHDSSMSGRKGTSTENIFFKGFQSEGSQQSERHRYLQPALGNGGWEGSRVEEQPASQVSVAGRPGVGPLWQVPEKKRPQSPPAPPPPLRSDSFVATKVFPYSDGPSAPPKSQGRSFEKTMENNQNFLRFQSHNQLHPNKLFSLSSSDISQTHYTQPPAHQRQYSDESPFYLQTRTAPPSKTQSVGSYYRSLQDLPTNAFSRKQVRHSTAFMAGCAAHPTLEGGGHNRYYSLAGKHLVQTGEQKSRQSRSDSWRGELEKPPWMSSSDSSFSSSLKTHIKAKYSIPQSQVSHGEKKERSAGSRLRNGLHYDNQTYEVSVQSRNPEDPPKGPPNDMKRLYQTSQSNEHKESRSLTERPPAASSTSVMSSQDGSSTSTSSSVKANRRSDRYATTLRKEVQQKRAQLQKSRSAATLTYEAEEDDVEEWRSTEASASSNTYKDHLKEAQARVLQATSFQRRDLEPLGPEATVPKPSNGRVRGRRQFHPAKRTHSFSEPDKMDKVGVEGESQTSSDPERKFFETKPAFSRPAPRSGHGPNQSSDLKEDPPSTEPEETPPPSDRLSPECEQALLEQQRLGTFAEYQATWNKQKKSSDTKTQGRYHSAENILDVSAEEKAACIHERSRSSPSADFCTQKIPLHHKDPQGQQSGLTTREKSESRSPDLSPQPVSSVPRNEGIVPDPDHRTKPNSTSPSHNTLSSGRRSVSPNSNSKQPAQSPQTQSLLPPPRPLLGPQTTSSSQEFLTGAQLDPAALQPLSSSGSDSQNHPTAHSYSAGPALTSSPLGTKSGPDSTQEEKEQLASPSSPPPPPSSSSSLSAGLACPETDRARSPSPLFVPLRLTDKPPAAFVQDDSRLRSETEVQVQAVMDVSGLKKVPIRIIHSEARSDQSNLHQTGIIPEPSPHISTIQPDQEQGQGSDLSQDSKSAGDHHLQDEAKREELARDIMGRDKSLVDILDQSGRKTTMDLMEGLFAPEEEILVGAQQRRRASAGSRLPTSNRREEEEVSASASLVPSSSYYNTSAPKAELLIKMKDMQEELEEQDSEDELDVDLASKKQELISSLAGKLEVLREAQQSLQEDVEDNEALGGEVEATVQHLCQPNQLEKFRMFVGDLDKVVSLLLSLSGRLARELKENLDRRERLVSSIMESHLDPESLDDYKHFVKMKSALIIEQRKLEDKIKLGEEQLKCLMESLPLEQRPLL